jgi:hypothetical protein
MADIPIDNAAGCHGCVSRGDQSEAVAAMARLKQPWHPAIGYEHSGDQLTGIGTVIAWFTRWPH